MRAWAEGKPQTGTGNNKGPGIVAPALPYALIQRSAWNRDSANFAFREFCELRLNGVL
jgi:hypothetical protein